MSHCLSKDSLRPKLVLQHHHALAMLNTPALTITASASVQSGPRSPRRTPSTARPARPSRRPSTCSAAEHIDERLHGVVVPTGRRRRLLIFVRRDVRGDLHRGRLSGARAPTISSSSSAAASICTSAACRCPHLTFNTPGKSMLHLVCDTQKAASKGLFWCNIIFRGNLPARCPGSPRPRGGRSTGRS